MYSFESRIRYSELDASEKLSIPALVNYFQDCSTFQSEELGVGLKYLHPRNLAWVVSSWQIQINRLPNLCEDVIIGTLPYEIKGFIGLRNFVMKTKSGEQLAIANSQWTLLDMDRMVPVRADDNMISRYKPEPKLDMEYAPRKITYPAEVEVVVKDTFLVQSFHMDGNGHVNNAQYINMSMPYVDAEREINQIRVEYKGQAHEGDTIVPKIVHLPDKQIVLLEDTEGSVYTVTEFTFL